jgi:hypothetical protein
MVPQSAAPDPLPMRMHDAASLIRMGPAVLLTPPHIIDRVEFTFDARDTTALGYRTPPFSLSSVQVVHIYEPQKGGVIRGIHIPPPEQQGRPRFLVEFGNGKARSLDPISLHISGIPEKLHKQIHPVGGFVYVMNDPERNTPLIKIGYAANAVDACREMRRGNPLIQLYNDRVCRDGKRTERLAHFMCDQFRVNNTNEWFRMTKEHAFVMCELAARLVDAAVELKQYH